MPEDDVLATERECQRLLELITAHTSANPILHATTNYEGLATFSLLELRKVAYAYKLIEEDPYV